MSLGVRGESERERGGGGGKKRSLEENAWAWLSVLLTHNEDYVCIFHGALDTLDNVVAADAYALLYRNHDDGIAVAAAAAVNSRCQLHAIVFVHMPNDRLSVCVLAFRRRRHGTVRVSLWYLCLCIIIIFNEK